MHVLIPYLLLVGLHAPTHHHHPWADTLQWYNDAFMTILCVSCMALLPTEPIVLKTMSQYALMDTVLLIARGRAVSVMHVLTHVYCVVAAFLMTVKLDPLTWRVFWGVQGLTYVYYLALSIEPRLSILHNGVWTMHLGSAVLAMYHHFRSAPMGLALLYAIIQSARR